MLQPNVWTHSESGCSQFLRSNNRRAAFFYKYYEKEITANKHRPEWAWMYTNVLSFKVSIMLCMKAYNE